MEVSHNLCWKSKRRFQERTNSACINNQKSLKASQFKHLQEPIPKHTNSDTFPLIRAIQAGHKSTFYNNLITESPLSLQSTGQIQRDTTKKC